MKHINGLGHIAIKVKDVDASMNFYNKVLELPEMLRLHHDDGSLFLIYIRITDHAFLEIFPGAETDRAPGLSANGVHHLCLTVDKLEPMLARVKENGGRLVAWKDGALVTVDEPQIGHGLDGNRGSWLEDPDGNRIELMEMNEDCIQYKAIRRLHAEMA
ncbi:VOC family protein [Rhizobium sp. BK251]|uniref:VOC family protein n=1 Tax=Rhizobium sp. BK251 TaxID=2512125 RepID=UPI00104F8927|nr:VOC family protein [Rhizobium sp. BK251]TCL71038.1 lactoylglutathione lyase [Rhizobium sp. BK251]